MKVLFLEKHDEMLSGILKKLGITTKIVANEVEAFVDEWKADKDVKVVVGNSGAMDCKVSKLCDALGMKASVKELIGNVSQDKINYLTFNEVEWLRNEVKPVSIGGVLGISDDYTSITDFYKDQKNSLFPWYGAVNLKVVD